MHKVDAIVRAAVINGTSTASSKAVPKVSSATLTPLLVDIAQSIHKYAHTGAVDHMDEAIAVSKLYQRLSNDTSDLTTLWRGFALYYSRYGAVSIQGLMEHADELNLDMHVTEKDLKSSAKDIREVLFSKVIRDHGPNARNQRQEYPTAVQFAEGLMTQLHISKRFVSGAWNDAIARALSAGDTEIARKASKDARGLGLTVSPRLEQALRK